MTKAQEAARRAEAIAADDTHGYQWGGWGPDYDCGHLVIDCYEKAGVPVKAAGASYTGNMRRAFMNCGFADVTRDVGLSNGAGLQEGDVLLNEEQHAAIYVGRGQLVQARSNFDGKPGDSSGQEIRRQAYYNFPWNFVLRLEETGQEISVGDAKDTNAPTINGLPTLQRGASGPVVEAAQLLLIGRGYPCGGNMAIDGREEPDSVFGPVMSASVFRWQADHDLDDDGIIGPVTWASMLGL